MESSTAVEFKRHEYRDGLSRICIEKEGGVVNVTLRSFRGSASASIQLTELSPVPGRVDVRDPAITSALQIASVVSMGGILAVEFARASVSWWTLAAAFGTSAAFLAASYFLVPLRRYATFTRLSGIHAFGLKFRAPEHEFKALVAALSESISQAHARRPSSVEAAT